MLGNGAGGYSVSDTKSAGGNPFQIAVGDVDGDGDADVVLANRGTNTLGVVKSNGAGGLLAAVTYPVGNDPAAVDLGDLDGDGDLDVVVSNYGGGELHRLLQRRRGRLPEPDHAAVDDRGIVRDDRRLRPRRRRRHHRDRRDRRSGAALPAGRPEPGRRPAAVVRRAAAREQPRGRAGFGTLPAEPLKVGRTAFLRLAGAPAQPFALALGVAIAPGTSTPFGLLNLDLALAPIVVIDGYAGGLVTNSFGEVEFAFPIDPSTPTGGIATLQALVGDPSSGAGSTLTNPETVVIVP